MCPLREVWVLHGRATLGVCLLPMLHLAERRALREAKGVLAHSPGGRFFFVVLTKLFM
jgi:hypothetical protein